MSTAFKIITQQYGLEQKKILDVGCGQSQFLKYFKEGSLGITTDPNEIEKGRSMGLNVALGNAEEIHTLGLATDFDVVWANNLFEHLLSPHGFLMKLKKVLGQESVVVLGVPVIPFPSVLMRLSWFRGSLASNHINFFTAKSLLLTVERAGYSVVTARPFISRFAILDRLLYFFSPHIYVVAKNNAAFTYSPKKIAEWHAEDYYSEMLNITNQK